MFPSMDGGEFSLRTAGQCDRNVVTNICLEDCIPRVHGRFKLLAPEHTRIQICTGKK